MGGANGLIVACVVAVWAAYFVPLVLRRYDDASTSSSLESLSPLSRVIPRAKGGDTSTGDAPIDDDTDREATPVTTERTEARGARSGDRESIQELDRAALATIEKPSHPSRATVTRQAAAIAARRRRRTLLTLLTALLVVGGLAVFSVIQPVWVAIPAGLIVAWLVACRVQVRGERGLSKPGRARGVRRPAWLRMPRRSARAETKRATTSRTDRSASSKRRGTAAEDEETVIVQLDDVEPERPHVMENVELAEDALDDQIVIAVPSVSTAGEALWDPLPVTVPTYVTKPRAGRTVRTIDFDAPGAWTSGHIEGQDVELPGRPDEAEAPRRASGE